MKKTHVNMGIIGLGQRGEQHLNLLLTYEDVSIVAVCDKYDDRAKNAGNKVKEKSGELPLVTTDYRSLLADKKVETVLISTDWELHIPIACAALEAGKVVALEVGGAYSVEDCYKLVRTQERTGTPFMFMENCCYNKDELLATALVRSGRFGKIVHCAGAYGHDLRSEVAYGKENRHYRLRNYLLRNTENYPTHELGPIAKILNINRGNRMVSLVSVASGAYGMHEYIMNNKDKVDASLLDATFRQGDIVNTVITCADGSTILMQLDTTLPRSYNRDLKVRGTRGMYEQATNSVFFDGDKEYWEPTEYYADVMNNAKKLEEDYLPEVWKKITPEEIAAGHGGMDSVMWRCFLDAYKNGEEMPIDVYDGAAWMVIAALAEESIAHAGAPVAIPDFTGGRWQMREAQDVMPLPNPCAK